MPLLGVKEDWSLKITAEELISRAKEEIEKSKKSFDNIVAVHDMKVSYDSVLKVQADLQAVFLSAQYYIEFPQHVSTDPDLREASAQAEKLLKEYMIEASMRRDVFRKLQIANNRGLRLKPEAQRYLWRSLRLGKRNGLLRSEDDQEQLKTIQKRISDLVIQYWKNLNEKETILEFSDKELDGMSADFIENLEKNPETEKYIVTLKYPDYIPIMEKCKVPETRRQLEFAFNSQCIEENHPLLDEIVKLRHKAANIKGYPNHATFVCEILMSGGPTIVRSFLWELKDSLAPLWEEEKKILLELKEKECQELGIPFDGELKPYDLGYYTNMVKETRYNVDHTKVKEYFPLNIVIKRVQNMYQVGIGKDLEICRKHIYINPIV